MAPSPASRVNALSELLATEESHRRANAQPQWCSWAHENSRFARSNGAANVTNGRLKILLEGHHQTQIRSRPLHVVLIGCQAQGVRSCDFQFLRRAGYRSEEHTSELQSLRHLVCRLLLEK